MKQFLSGVVIALVLTAGFALAAEKTFQLRPIIAATDPAQCAAHKGKAALVATIDEKGYLTSEWESFCLLEVK